MTNVCNRSFEDRIDIEFNSIKTLLIITLMGKNQIDKLIHLQE